MMCMLRLYAQWGLSTFENISRSEQAHTEAIKALLDRYNLSDPATETVGVFTNPDLQALYNDLAARGQTSLSEALKVGAAIEEIDILDLQERLAQTDNADIQQVFNNLLSGSNNHLRAFVTALSRQTGEVYQPQYLSAEAYQDIVAPASQSGGLGPGQQAGRRQSRRQTINKIPVTWIIRKIGQRVFRCPIFLKLTAVKERAHYFSTLI